MTQPPLTDADIRRMRGDAADAMFVRLCDAVLEARQDIRACEHEMEGEVSKARRERDQFSAEVAVLRGDGCEADGDGPCGACVKCLRRERDAARAAIAKAVEGFRADVETMSPVDARDALANRLCDLLDFGWPGQAPHRQEGT